MTSLSILIGLGALLTGTGIGFFLRANLVKNKVQSAEARAEKIMTSAKAEEQAILLKAKEQALKSLEEGKTEEKERREEMRTATKRLEERENRFDKRILELEDKKTELEKKHAQTDTLREEIEKLKVQEEEKLQQVASMTKEAAKEEIFRLTEEEYSDALASRLRKLDQQNEEDVEREAHKILSLAVQRFASSHVTDSTTTMVELSSEDMKGRIIGKEGRNIKALERLTGCEIIIDDTPQMVTISGFSPVRRQVAKIALVDLMKDGRIQPARIETAVAAAKQNLAKEMRKSGEEALVDLGIPVSSIDPKLVSILGRLKYRTSYGQNVLQHSIEVARISGMIAEELGANVFNCKKGGLFHDIGKAVDHDMQGAHPEIGYNIMRKFGFKEELCYQSIAHHEDKPRTIEGVIVKAADAISGARPGARRNSIEDYIQRLKNLEATANEFPGVEKAYAIQAGREVRVFVEPQKIDDFAAFKLAKNIAKKIENDLTYPGEVKVTIIRETRVSEFAR
jgi:ribonucrease Y